jgi:hypothetical protein
MHQPLSQVSLVIPEPTPPLHCRLPSKNLPVLFRGSGRVNDDTVRSVHQIRQNPPTPQFMLPDPLSFA